MLLGDKTCYNTLAVICQEPEIQEVLSDRLRSRTSRPFVSATEIKQT